MKKVVLFFCIVALLISAAQIAMASDNYWVVKFKAGVYNGSTMSGATVTTIGAREDPGAGNPITFASNSANLGISSGTLYTNTQFQPLADSYIFHLRLAVGMDFADTANPGWVYITAWTPDAYLGVAGRALPTNYRVSVLGDGIGLTWTYNNLYLAQDPSISAVGPVGFWYNYGMKSSSWAQADDFFTVMVEPVPEPGSLMALGSGLVGLAGYAIRKRRA